MLFGPPGIQGPRGTADRLKMFEAVQANGSIPSDGKGGNRDFDLVAIVDAKPGYEGTAAIIRSPFWRLIDNKKLSLREVRLMVVECFALLDLAKQQGNYAEDGESQANDWKSELEELVQSNPELTIEDFINRQSLLEHDYDNAMAKAFLSIEPSLAVEPSLDFLALTGALAIEAIYAGNRVISLYQVDIFKSLLKVFCRQPWLVKVSDELYETAEKSILGILNEDALKGLPDYVTMLSNIPDVNLNSAAAALLKRHQTLLWRR